MADDLPQEPVAAGGGRQEAAASLREPAVRKVDCCLGAEEEVQRILVSTQPRSLPVGEGELRASPVERREVEVHWRPGWVWVLQGVTADAGPRDQTGSPGLVEVCWVREEGALLECLVWMRDSAGPWEDRGRCYGNRRGLPGV